MMSIIKKPIITEKMTSQSEKYNRYAFVVDRKVNKIEIKKAVAEMYDVTVDSVRTMMCIGKKRVRGTKSGMIVGKTSTYKKAIVTLAEGDTIDFYSNI
jgi:large subunit ribosomal protein L23